MLFGIPMLLATSFLWHGIVCLASNPIKAQPDTDLISSEYCTDIICTQSGEKLACGFVWDVAPTYNNEPGVGYLSMSALSICNSVDTNDIDGNLITFNKEVADYMRERQWHRISDQASQLVSMEKPSESRSGATFNFPGPGVLKIPKVGSLFIDNQTSVHLIFSHPIQIPRHNILNARNFYVNGLVDIMVYGRLFSGPHEGIVEYWADVYPGPDQCAFTPPVYSRGCDVQWPTSRVAAIGADDPKTTSVAMTVSVIEGVNTPRNGHNQHTSRLNEPSSPKQTVNTGLIEPPFLTNAIIYDSSKPICKEENATAFLPLYKGLPVFTARPRGMKKLDPQNAASYHGFSCGTLTTVNIRRPCDAPPVKCRLENGQLKTEVRDPHTTRVSGISAAIPISICGDLFNWPSSDGNMLCVGIGSRLKDAQIIPDIEVNCLRAYDTIGIDCTGLSIYSSTGWYNVTALPETANKPADTKSSKPKVNDSGVKSEVSTSVKSSKSDTQDVSSIINESASLIGHHSREDFIAFISDTDKSPHGEGWTGTDSNTYLGNGVDSSSPWTIVESPQGPKIDGSNPGDMYSFSTKSRIELDLNYFDEHSQSLLAYKNGKGPTKFGSEKQDMCGYIDAMAFSPLYGGKPVFMALPLGAPSYWQYMTAPRGHSCGTLIKIDVLRNCSAPNILCRAPGSGFLQSVIDPYSASNKMESSVIPISICEDLQSWWPLPGDVICVKRHGSDLKTWESIVTCKRAGDKLAVDCAGYSGGSMTNWYNLTVSAGVI